MRRSTRRLMMLLASLPLALLLYAVLYMLGMTYLEGRPHTLWASIEWAAETLTTTGYGADARWTHPVMVAYVILVQFSGLFLVFLIFPVYVLPFFEERFEARIPRVLPEMSGRVLIYQYGPAVASLIEELHRSGRDAVLVESDEATARRLQQRGQPVVMMDLAEERFDPERLAAAQALVANGSDHENATLVMIARENGYQGPIYAIAEDPLHRPAIANAGATAVFTPRHVLAAALAARVSERISPSVSGAQQIGGALEIAQLRVRVDSPFARLTLGEAQIRERLGVTVIGVWKHGVLVDRPNSDTRLDPGSIVVAAGSPAAVARLAASTHPLARGNEFVVAGYGTVGRKVAEFLRDAGEQVRIVNDVAADGVDVVGNMLQTETLAAAGVRDARAVILAVGNDSETLFAAAVVREYAPQVTLVARVNQDHGVERLHRLGADFALSIGQVAGQLLAFHLLGELFVSVEPDLKVMEVGAQGLVGLHPWRAGVRERTDCQIVAVGRGDAVEVEFSPEFRIEAGDVLYLCGAPDALEGYFAHYPGARPRPDA